MAYAMNPSGSESGSRVKDPDRSCFLVPFVSALRLIASVPYFLYSFTLTTLY